MGTRGTASDTKLYLHVTSVTKTSETKIMNLVSSNQNYNSVKSNNTTFVESIVIFVHNF